MIQTLSIIVPVYNEEATIAQVLRSLFVLDLSADKAGLGSIKKEIIVIDDGSRDRTPALLKNTPGEFQLFTHAYNQGKGAAIQTALKHTTGDYVVIQDADLEYDPHDILRLLEMAKENPEAAIYGSRNLEKKTRGYFFYYWGGRFLTLCVNALYGTRLSDINTGYKFFPRNVLEKFSLTSRGFEFCEEITVKLLRAKIPIIEIPVSYHPRPFSEGKKISFKDGLIGIKAIIQYSLDL